MASFFGISKPGAKGLDIRTHTVRLEAHTALSKGNVVALSATPGTTTEGTVLTFDTTAAPAASATTTGLSNGIFAVALEDVAAGEVGMFAMSGVVDCIADNSHAVGSALSATTGLKVDETASNEKVIGYALEASTGANDLKKVLFDGLNGFSGNKDS
jgi:predicted RecA/RadA family phage recombinase